LDNPSEESIAILIKIHFVGLKISWLLKEMLLEVTFNGI